MIDRAERARVWPEPDLRDAFANAPTALAVTTPAGIITAANSALATLLGCDAASLVGGTFLAMTHLLREADERMYRAKRHCRIAPAPTR